MVKLDKSRMVELTIRNEHSGITFTEQVEAGTVSNRVNWYAERSAKYAPGWTVTRVR